MSLKSRILVSFLIVIIFPFVLILGTIIGGHFLRGSEIKMAMDMIMLMVIVLVITGVVLLTWLNESITKPMEALTKATKKLRDGDLNTPVKEEGPKEFQELCRDLEEMRVRLKEANEAKIRYDKESKELISNISHDLRTPIAAVKGYVEGIMDGVASTPEKMDKYIRTIYNKTNEMDRLINELTIYSKIDTDRLPYNFRKVNVRDFFDDMSEDMRIELESANVFFTYKDEAGAKDEIIADPEQIKRVMNNILSNSLKYMDKLQRHIDMRIIDDNEVIHVEIKDNGKGISKKDIANVFNRFYRADASRHSGSGGSGIGLSIVKKIMEDHGGRVWATSVEGEETTMHLEFRKYAEVPVNEQNINS